MRVYTGRPDSAREPQKHAAHMRQCSNWEKAGAKVITRPLRYPKEWPTSKAQQKGIDVAIAIDFVAFAVDRVHDAGVLASWDTDLVPALEFVMNIHSNECSSELIGFNCPQVGNICLRTPNDDSKYWRYWLNKDDYDSIADLTRYGKQEKHIQRPLL